MDYWRNVCIESFRTHLFAEGHLKECELSLDWHNKHGTGEKEAIIQRNSERIHHLFSSTWYEAVPTLMIIIATLPAMFLIGWQWGVIAVLTFVAYLAIMIISEPKLQHMRADYHREQKAYELFGAEMTSNYRTIKAFGLENDVNGKLERMLETFRQNEFPRHVRWRNILINLEHLLSTSRFAITGVGIYLAVKHHLSIGSFVLAVSWMIPVFSNYNRLTSFQHHLHRGLSALKELATILATEPTVKPAASPVWSGNIEGRIELRSVCFRYPENPEDILSDINLTIEPNQVVAIIGKSGSGKTTLVSLLNRMADPVSGAILLDGIDLRHLDYTKLRNELTAVVHQNPELFNTTVRENIRVANPSAPTGAEVNAAQLAYANEFIDSFPEGYNTLVGENGVRLSGGQKQRLCIARALMRQPKLLLLDEPTSALDGESQQEVKKALANLTKRRQSTIVIIAHRHSTIEMADLIVVMDKGRIVEVGTHQALLKKNGFYVRLRNFEMEGALDTTD